MIAILLVMSFPLNGGFDYTRPENSACQASLEHRFSGRNRVWGNSVLQAPYGPGVQPIDGRKDGAVARQWAAARIAPAALG